MCIQSGNGGRERVYGYSFIFAPITLIITYNTFIAYATFMVYPVVWLLQRLLISEIINKIFTLA